jgi:hypothetical protein
MYAGIAVTILAMAAVLARGLKDIMVICLIRTLTRDVPLTGKQRLEVCARLAATLGPGATTPDRPASGLDPGDEAPDEMRPARSSTWLPVGADIASPD